MENILEEIRKERERQDNKWGVQNHNPFVWLAIIGEEKGEADEAALEAHFDHMGNHTFDDYRKELIEVASTAVAAIECLDRSRNNTDSSEWEKVDYSHPDGYPDSETGELYEILTDKNNIYRGYFMDWGFVPKDETARTVEENGEEIKSYRRITNE